MKRYKAILSATSLVVLASCGGGSGDSSIGGANSPIATLEIGAGDASAPADTVDTLVLQQKAAENAGRAIGVNVAGVRTVTADTNTLVNAATLPDGMLNDDNGFDADLTMKQFVRVKSILVMTICNSVWSWSGILLLNWMRSPKKVGRLSIYFKTILCSVSYTALMTPLTNWI